MADELERKYDVKILSTEEKVKFPDALKAKLKESGMMDDKGKLKLKGVSPKMLKRMKQEYVECPVLKEDIQFVQCFICPNFQSSNSSSKSVFPVNFSLNSLFCNFPYFIFLV